MNIALLVGFSILFTLELAASALIYSHYIYSRNRIFSKIKPSIMWIVICAVISAFLIATSIYFCIDLTQWNNSLKFDVAFIVLSFLSLSLSIVYLIYFAIVSKIVNKNKIDYKDMLHIDYVSKVKELETQIGDVERLKTTIETKFPKYYHEMLNEYKTIVNRAKNSQIPIAEKMADIVVFNDTFTHKWCGFVNNYQKLLTFKFCEIFQKFS